MQNVGYLTFVNIKKKKNNKKVNLYSYILKVFFAKTEGLYNRFFVYLVKCERND